MTDCYLHCVRNIIQLPILKFYRFADGVMPILWCCTMVQHQPNDPRLRRTWRRLCHPEFSCSTLATAGGRVRKPRGITTNRRHSHAPSFPRLGPRLSPSTEKFIPQLGQGTVAEEL